METLTCGIQVEADKHSNQSYAEQEHTQHRISQKPHPAIAMRIPAQREERRPPSPLKGERNWCRVIDSNCLKVKQFYP